MRGNYNNGGGKKEFKADPIKQFLISRGTARDRAVDLCCAGKIDLNQIPDYTDRLTILHFGQISVDPMVDAEILRIAQRVKARTAPDNEETPPETEPENKDAPILCDDCVHGPQGTGECNEAGTWDQCQDYEAPGQDEPERQTPTTEERDPVYHCGTCSKEYKTLRGLQKHKEIEHGK
jgi:hypothetical protein